MSQSSEELIFPIDLDGEPERHAPINTVIIVPASHSNVPSSVSDNINVPSSVTSENNNDVLYSASDYSNNSSFPPTVSDYSIDNSNRLNSIGDYNNSDASTLVTSENINEPSSPVTSGDNVPSKSTTPNSPDKGAVSESSLGRHVQALYPVTVLPLRPRRPLTPSNPSTPSPSPPLSYTPPPPPFSTPIHPRSAEHRGSASQFDPTAPPFRPSRHQRNGPIVNKTTPVQESLETVKFQFRSIRSSFARMSWPFDGNSPPKEGEFERFEKASIEELLQQNSIPFGSISEMYIPSRKGVLKISNIPYTVTRQEVASFLGRSAKQLPSSQGCPIHIIMERSTGKTMDCFVEFLTEQEAQDAVARLSRSYDASSTPRMGSRHVDIEMSSQAQFLKAVFPLAKCMSWVEGRPVQLENRDEWSTGFDGFITDEELFCLVRHAEQPHRSAFANKVPQRCYESFITTIWKFPWHATHLYTVHHRNALFLTLCKLIKTLVERMSKQNTIGLDTRILIELVQTGLSCPAFNPRMKYCFAWYSQDAKGIQGLDHDWCLYFPFDTLTYVPGHYVTAIKYYAYLMSHGSVLRTEEDGLCNKHGHPDIERIFGMFWFEWDHKVARKLVFKNAITYEASVLRKFIITGFQHLRRRTSSISTIGTAPHSSPNHSISSLDSERTISAMHSGSVNRPAPRQAYTLSSAGGITSNFRRLGHDWNVPGNSRGGSRAIDTDQFPPDTPTRQPRRSVQPYRPPHSRFATSSSTPYDQAENWRVPQDQTRTSYYAPHPTAHNVRSSSDPFGPLPSAASNNQRSRSDASRQMANIDRRYQFSKK